MAEVFNEKLMRWLSIQELKANDPKTKYVFSVVMQKVEELSEVKTWIDYTFKQPPKAGDYLTTIKIGKAYHLMVNHYSGTTWKMANGYVLAWMYLPDIYKVKTQGWEQNNGI